jgi:hypothetical protein
MLQSGQYDTIYWKCDDADCGGRGISQKLAPPLVHSKRQTIHLPRPERLEQLKTKNNCRQLAVNSNEDPSSIIARTHETISEEALLSISTRAAFTQFINRQRKKHFNVKTLKAKCVEDLEVPDSLHKTLRGDNFYFGKAIFVKILLNNSLIYFYIFLQILFFFY